MPARRVVTLLALLSAAFAVGACGSRPINHVRGGDSAEVRHGAQLFAERCAGCHTLDVAGTEGSATKIRDRERVDGPNFNTRKETVDQVLYALHNGGFSGAIMPENIVVGQDANAVAQFLAQNSGLQAKAPKGPGQ